MEVFINLEAIGRGFIAGARTSPLGLDAYGIYVKDRKVSSARLCCSLSMLDTPPAVVEPLVQYIDSKSEDNVLWDLRIPLKDLWQESQRRVRKLLKELNYIM